MIWMICKFCGCTDRTPCLIPASYITDPDFVVAGNVVPCEWLVPSVCTAPPCVERAYKEACKLVDTLLDQEIAA
jgi:hypothetical protein